MAIEDIRKRWTDTERGFVHLSFKQAKSDMDTLMAEVDRLQGIEKEKALTDKLYESALLRFRNNQTQIISEIEAVVRKYDPY